MAIAKLTLSVNADTIERAKEYARRNHTSLSKVVQNLLDDIAKEDPLLEKFEDEEISPEILALTGILKGKYPDNVDYREAYREHLSKKHGL
jgi:hypothetical protein